MPRHVNRLPRRGSRVKGRVRVPLPRASGEVEGVSLRDLLDRLNRRVTALLDRDHQIGHSYLMGVNDVPGLRFAWYHRVVPLLQEYFYNDGPRLRAVLGRAFVRTITPATDLFDETPESYDADADHYEIETFEDDDDGFLAAIGAIIGGAGSGGEPAEPSDEET